MPRETSASASVLFDTLSGFGIDAGVCQTAEFRRRSDLFADVRLFFKDPGWPRSAEGQRLARGLASHRDITSARYQRSALLLRFTEAFILSLGERLERNDKELSIKGLLPERAYLMSFVSPNTTKALHVGHLRNIALGGALATVLAKFGASVQTGSLVGDIGRSACEAAVIGDGLQIKDGTL